MKSFWLKSNLAVACHDLLTPPNQVRRSEEISQLTGEDQRSIPHLAERVKGLALHAIPSFAEAVSSLAAMLLSRYKIDWLNLFPNFQDDYTPVLPINSLPRRDRQKRREEIGSRSRIPSKRALPILCSPILWTKWKRVLLGGSSIIWSIASSKG